MFNDNFFQISLIRAWILLLKLIISAGPVEILLIFSIETSLKSFVKNNSFFLPEPTSLYAKTISLFSLTYPKEMKGKIKYY